MNGQQQLGTIKDLALQHQEKTFKRIEDYPKIHVGNQITKRTCVTSEGKEFDIKEMFLYNEDTGTKEGVRIPNSVIGGLKILLQDNPNLEYFRVIRTGVGMDTRYTVLPVNNGVE